MSSPVTFDLPRSFDPGEFLPHRLLTRADDAKLEGVRRVMLDTFKEWRDGN